MPLTVDGQLDQSSDTEESLYMFFELFFPRDDTPCANNKSSQPISVEDANSGSRYPNVVQTSLCFTLDTIERL